MTETTDTQKPAARGDHAQRRRARVQQRANTSRRRLGLWALGVFGAVLLVSTVAEAALTAGRIHPGVTVANVPVGGMTPDNARAALKMNLPTRAADPVVVRHGTASWPVAATAVGLDFNYDAQVARAMRIGRMGGVFDRLGQRVSAWTSGIDLAAMPLADDVKMNTVLSTIAEKTDVAPVDATVEFDGTVPEVVDGRDGEGLDRQRARALILKAFTASGAARTVTAPVVTVPLAVDSKAAAEAARVATAMVKSPVTVTYAKKSWTFEPEDIAEWIDFKAVVPSSAGEDGTEKAALGAFVSPELAGEPITKALGTKVGRPAVDARFTTSDGRVTIIPSKDGIGPDIESLSVALTDELKNDAADRVVELRTTRARPKITTEKARGMGIRERISTYTTTFEAGNRPRVNNIHLLGGALDGALIEPGGVFSFNGIAGERTAAKGYQEANAIVNGKLVPQLGGGVCQVGTTVFNAAFESGLPVIERKNHSFYISHYPTGRDATVSWGGPDLKFKNDTEHWVLVSVSYTNSSITVSLYGTDPGYEVKAEVGAWTNMKPFSTEEVKDAKLPSGSRVIEDSGVSGRSISVKRIVTKGGKVVRTDTFVSNYKPKSQIVRVGTKRTSSNSATPTP